MNFRFRQHFWDNSWLLSITAGVLLGISFPPFPFPFLEFPAFFLLLRIITLSKSAGDAARKCYPGFLVWNIIATYWLMLASLAAGIAAILANALVMSAVVMLLYLMQKKIQNSWLTALLQTCCWVGYEYLHHHWDLSWPWLALGNAWANVPLLIQYISATGFLGISFWVMLTTTLAYQAFMTERKALRWASLFIAMLFPVISLIWLPFITTGSNQKVETEMVQPDYNTYKTYGGYATPMKALNAILALSDSVRTPSTKFIAWPESGIFPYLSNRRMGNYAINQLKEQLKSEAAQWDATIVGGTRYYEYYSPNHHPPLAERSGNIPFLVYNAAVGFYPDSTVQVYRKHNLVPVVERLPFVHFFHAIDVFGWINWAANQGFGEGHTADQFKAGSTKTPALICYDSVFPGWVRNFVLHGAGFLTVITDDGWWGNTSGHIQHFAYGRLRAIEFRRWVLSSSNNGTSGVIAPDGSVKIRTKYGQRTAFLYDVPVLTSLSFYTRWGDWLPTFCLIFSALGIIYLLYIKLGKMLLARPD